MSEEKIVQAFCHSFNPKSNGGESLTFSTRFLDAGKGAYITCQEINLMSYNNSVTITLGDIITPENLRELANKLESANNKMQDWKYKNMGKKEVSNPCCKGKLSSESFFIGPSDVCGSGCC